MNKSLMMLLAGVSFVVVILFGSLFMRTVLKVRKIKPVVVKYKSRFPYATSRLLNPFYIFGFTQEVRDEIAYDVDIYREYNKFPPYIKKHIGSTVKALESLNDCCSI